MQVPALIPACATTSSAAGDFIFGKGEPHVPARACHSPAHATYLHRLHLHSQVSLDARRSVIPSFRSDAPELALFQVARPPSRHLPPPPSPCSRAADGLPIPQNRHVRLPTHR